MPIRKGLRGGDFLSAQRCQWQGVKRLKNTTPSLVELASVLGSMGFHRAGEAGVWGKPQEKIYWGYYDPQ